ncbi:type 4a pilus biogenesis protein PilO [Neisseriaceae bacterium B1]
MNLNEIDFKKLHLQSKGIQFACALILSIIIIGIGYLLLFNDQYTEYQSLKEKEVALKEDFSKKSILAANLPNLKEELRLIEETINDLLKQLPTDAQIPSLIQEMHQAAANNGLTMNNVTPQPPINDSQIQRLPFSISLTGNHTQIANFTRDLGRVSRIVTLSDISLKNAESNDLTGNKLTFSALANTYKALDIKSNSPASSASATDKSN